MDEYGIIKTHEALKKSLSDYIKTAYFGKNDTLRNLCEDELDRQGVLWQEPYIEANPAYKSVSNGIEESTKIPREMRNILKVMSERKLGVFKNPFVHQLQAVESFCKGKDLFVATGTGSGKTECFMWPMVGSIVKEAMNTPDTWSQRGVRALMLYPMNALVADQLGRLRRMIGEESFLDMFHTKVPLGRNPQFGMYTGRTPYPGESTYKKNKQLSETLRNDLVNRNDKAIEQLKRVGKFPAKYNLENFVDNLLDDKHITDPKDTELITRFEMQKHTPDILITNYSMLEYMLMRQEEQNIWLDTKKWLESSSQNKLLFIIDEAHMYRGAAGGEVALLIRRFMNKLGIRRDRIQFILTSASVPSGRDDEVIQFVCDITGEEFEKNQVDIIKGEQEEINYDHVVNASANVLANFDIDELQGDIRQKLEAIKTFGKLTGLRIDDIDFTNESEVERWLYSELSRFYPMLQIMKICRGNAVPFSELAKKVFPNVDIYLARKATSAVLAIAPLAKNEEGSVLFPSRLHMMFRGLQTVCACMNPNCTEKSQETDFPIGKVYLGSQTGTCKCGGKIYELVNDRTCGALFFKGYVDESESGDRFVWNQPDLSGDSAFKEVIFYIIPNNQDYIRPKSGKQKININWFNGIAGRICTDDSKAGNPHYVKIAYTLDGTKDNPQQGVFASCPKCKKTD